jgi:hypothetical protein
MNAYYTTTAIKDTLCVLEKGHPACVDFGAPSSSYMATLNPEPLTASPLVFKPATGEVATARTQPPAANRSDDADADKYWVEGATARAPPPAANRIDEADAAKYWAFVDKKFPKEKSLYKARTAAKKALKKCKDDWQKDVLQRSLDEARAAYKRYIAKADAAYDNHLREEAREYASDSDYAPTDAEDVVDDEWAEADAFYAPSDADEESVEPVEEDEPAPKKDSKRKFPGPAVGPVKKKTRAPRGSKPRIPLPTGCGCSCGGVRCHFAQDTAEICFDKTTQRVCCSTCGVLQKNARSFFFGSMNPKLAYATRSACWLNQSVEVRELGLGGGRQVKNRKAAAAMATAEE